MDVSGGGVLVAVAAALWVAYLLPSWFRRRQYLATERNAVRLQQTLRILAETAETPEEVHVDATAREVAKQQRRLRKRRRELDRAAELRIDALIGGATVAYGDAEPDAASGGASAWIEAAAVDEGPEGEPRAEQGAEPYTAAFAIVPGVDAREATDPAPAAPGATTAPVGTPRPGSDPDAVARARRVRAALRRGRLACTLSLLAALATIGVGAGILVGGDAFAGSLVLGGGSLLVVLAWSGLARLGRRHAVIAPVASVEPVPDEVRPEEPTVPEAAADDDAHEWTPRPLPRPLTLSRGTIAAMAMASVEEAARLGAAAKAEEFERRAAELEDAAVPSLPAVAERRAEPAAEPAAESSPYARMGYLDEDAAPFDGLDSVLARRRAAG